ncbi:MAG: hypothetical protein M1812_001525 [Candelaria pacifica]|nr:MAG: hypothetical protein M1812_001525 [Candelaria pacifica]
MEWSSVLALVSHIEDFRHQGGDRWEEICLMSKGAEMYSGTGLSRESVLELFCRTFAQVLINSLTLVTPVFEPLGISFDPLAAMANHSCDPNAVVVFDGPNLSFRPLRDIAHGEEITISYIDCTNPCAKRQGELRDRYFFTCACSKCQNGRALREDNFLGDVLDFAELGAAENKAFTLLENARSLELKLAEKVLQQAVQAMLDHQAVWPRDRQPWPSVRQQLTINLLSRGVWVSALAHMLKTYFYVDPILFPQPFHPVRVVHNWTLVRIVLLVSSLSASDPGVIGQLDKFELDYGTIIWALLIEVEGNVDVSHGSESTLALTVRQKVEEVKVDMTRGGTRTLAILKDRLDKEWVKMRAVSEALVD